MNRFVDDVSTLAIEDCLISKLSTLFRPRNVADMSSEDIRRLAGETRESSLERERLEVKRKVLEIGLQGLKSLHKRRIVVDPPKLDQAVSDDSERISVVTPSRSKKESVATSSAESSPPATIPDEPSHYREWAVTPPPTDEWPPQAEFHGHVERVEPLSFTTKIGEKKKASKKAIKRPPEWSD